MNVKAGIAVVADGNVADRAQDFALFGDLDFPVGLLLEIEPADNSAFEGADDGQRGRGYPGVVGGFRQRRKGLFARLENGDAGLGSRVAGYFSGLHRRQAALRWVWRPSLISSMILALKASKSPGLREVMTPSSTKPVQRYQSVLQSSPLLPTLSTIPTVLSWVSPHCKNYSV